MSAGTVERQKVLERREQQIKEAEEMLGDMADRMGFAKCLFIGKFKSDWMFPYPYAKPGQKPAVDAKVKEVEEYCKTKLDAFAIDRMADIPRSTINDLGKLGVLGLTAPKEVGGQDFTQGDYCRVLEHFGGTCSSTSIFINAHHSIGMRALLLFGTKEQKERWLPPMVRGEKLGAFALTEEQAGSDAGNVQTVAKPSADGTHFIMNGTKRYITNAAIADVLTVMARTPGPDGSMKMTAFLVTPDMPGFEITKARGEKMGIRGTATGWLKFTDMPVPRANILGQEGKGLKVALTVLDFGRTTFGACCTGSAKTALKLMMDCATTRKQFKRTLAEFDLVKKKIAQASAWIYAMEAMTYTTASLIDRGFEDFMVETAMLKVWTTEALWQIIMDSFQINGGGAYFTDHPLERMLRDARINQIGEGANDVLRSFAISLVGIKGPGLALKATRDAALAPWKGVGPIIGFFTDQARRIFGRPSISVQNASLQGYANRLAKQVHTFGAVLQKVMFKYREDLLDEQLVHERIAEAAMEIFASSCALARLDAETSQASKDPNFAKNKVAAEYFLDWSSRKIDDWLRAIGSNDDKKCLATANAVLGG
jgi:acyl-CoA dehydrogenase family protein 9